jgi:hypothetical protein
MTVGQTIGLLFLLAFFTLGGFVVGGMVGAHTAEESRARQDAAALEKAQTDLAWCRQHPFKTALEQGRR